MKFLCFSDIHGIPWKMQRLEALASEADAVLIGGDLIDAWGDTLRQALAWYHWFRRVQKPVAIGEGNHDYLDGDKQSPDLDKLPEEEQQLIVRMLTGGQHWFRLLPHTLPSGTSKLTIGKESVLVTTLPWEAHDGYWREGAEQRKQLPWIVVGHEPPSKSSVSEPTTGSDNCRHLISIFQPTVFLCGHVHTAPFSSRTASCKLKKTLAINPGCNSTILTYGWLTVTPAKQDFEWKCEEYELAGKHQTL